MKNFGLVDKNIIVTGASGFLGKIICNALMHERANIYEVDITDENCAVDIADSYSVRKYMLGFGGMKIDGLVNNAAISFKAKDISDENFSKTLETNITGCKNMISNVAPVMNNGGSVVNISSVYSSISPDFNIYNGDEDLYNNVSYGASKAAIDQMTRYYARLYNKIRVNAIAPGGIFQGHSEDFVTKYSERVPLNRMADPEEVVNSILFMISGLSSYINGHVLVVDGGLTA